jgi:hypothetical protein
MRKSKMSNTGSKSNPEVHTEQPTGLMGLDKVISYWPTGEEFRVTIEIEPKWDGRQSQKKRVERITKHCSLIENEFFKKLMSAADGCLARTTSIVYGRFELDEDGTTYSPDTLFDAVETDHRSVSFNTITWVNNIALCIQFWNRANPDNIVRAVEIARQFDGEDEFNPALGAEHGEAGELVVAPTALFMKCAACDAVLIPDVPHTCRREVIELLKFEYLLPERTVKQ